MKRLFTAIIVMAALGSSGIAPRAAAQDQAASPLSGSMQIPGPDEVVNILATKLALSEDQKSRIRPIIADRQQKIAALRADTSLRKGKRLRQLKSVLDDSDQHIKAILNDQQKEQYTQIEQQMRDQIRQRMRERGSADSAQ
jgi:protein CpxP